LRRGISGQTITPRAWARPNLQHALEDGDVHPDPELATDLLLYADEAKPTLQVQAKRGLMRGDHMGDAGVKAELGGDLHQASEQDAPNPTTPELLVDVDRVLH
jgi:hypothetical protein